MRLRNYINELSLKAKTEIDVDKNDISSSDLEKIRQSGFNEELKICEITDLPDMPIKSKLYNYIIEEKRLKVGRPKDGVAKTNVIHIKTGKAVVISGWGDWQIHSEDDKISFSPPTLKFREAKMELQNLLDDQPDRFKIK